MTRNYEGRRAQFGYEELGRMLASGECVRQGVSKILQELESAEPMFEDKFDERIRARTGMLRYIHL